MRRSDDAVGSVGLASLISRQTWNQTQFAAWLLVLITFIAYLPVCQAGFIWDDDVMLTENPAIKSQDGLSKVWCGRAADDFVPVTMTVLWFEWRLWGSNPLGYHLLNLLLHVGNALLLWRILLRLKIPGAWLAAMLFAIHPVNVESVAWISQLKNTLSMLLYLAAVRFYLTFEDSGKRRWFWLAAGMFLLALLGKTAVVPLPVVLLGLAWWRRRRIDPKDLQRDLVFVALAAIGSLLAIGIQRGATAGMTVRADSFWARLAASGWAIWFYLGKALVPLRLIFVYPRWKVPADNPLSYLPLLLWMALLFMCWRSRARWGRPVLLALGYFTVMLLPILGFVDIYFMRFSLVADHWQYFAIIGPIALVAAGAEMAFASLAILNKWAPALGTAVLLAVMSALTWTQCGIYADAETLWLNTLRSNPACWLARYNLGLYYYQQGRLDYSIANNQKAVELKPDFADAHNNLGLDYLQAGRIEDAIAHFQKAAELKSGYAEIYNNLGTAILRQGKPAEAAAWFQKALAINPHLAGIHNQLGVCHSMLGRMNEAIAQFQQALQIQPDHVETLKNLAWVYATCADASLRNGSKALALANRANELTGGGEPLVLHALAAAEAESGNFRGAVETAQQALTQAGAKSNTRLAALLQTELKLYRAGQPFHTPVKSH